ncbi:MAG: phosphodiester glycosidase family protein [Fimbriimonadaceae bacterium]|nr:phosphodiester glycosidase family protein [Fimbriimonadaceae bacterium]
MVFAFSLVLSLNLKGIPQVQNRVNGAPTVKVERIRAGGIDLVLVRGKLSELKPVVIWAQGQVGKVESIAGMAVRGRAQAAINGGYFDAYSNDGIADPYHTIFQDGHIESLGSVGSVLGFGADGKALAERGNPKITGQVGSQSFYLYRANHTPGANVAARFGPEWGARVGFSGAFARVGADGTVIDTGNGDPAIPVGGSVYFFRGSDASSVRRFAPGARVTVKLNYTNVRDQDFWAAAETVIGCGPLLVRGGTVALDAAGEGFTSSRVTGGGARSAIGVNATGEVLLVCGSGTFTQMANAMKALGCNEAIGLDGGASSGLWASGTTLRREGRQISHVVALVPR